MLVLTADVAAGQSSISVDTFSHLTASEIQAFVTLRVDSNES